ncbi:hypothetical protein [Nissabacter sp. SGAir0207]|uniref:hypothetical protein n=1 Tax=Nissabacter sp. SGAir0207 TaxID=2126321 RepID=UPI0010CD1DB7|nr:hypothetical protein [Nissabacter sp. SGAir0207]QCR38267.1 hypothetical protein C1N62_19170 [Nissabacter sp. SGAir0207]
MRKFSKLFPYLLALLLGGVLAVAVAAGLLLYSRVAPADAAYQRACQHYPVEEVKGRLIRAWLRSAAGDDQDALGWDRLAFTLTPHFDASQHLWSGDLTVTGSASTGHYMVMLDCNRGQYEQSILEEPGR